MTGWRRISAFVPERCDPELLEQVLVGRETLLEDAVSRVADGLDGGSKHNLLYVGPSGIGKTMLMALIAHRLRESRRLGPRLCLASLDVVELSPSFLDLLLRVHRALSAAYPESFAAADIQDLLDLPEEETLSRLQALLHRGLDGRLLVLQIEDLEACFKALGTQGQNRWRAFLQEHASAMVLATSPRLFEGVSSRESPFFGFFQVEHLQALTLQQGRELMDRLAHIRHKDDLLRSLQSPTARACIQSLHFVLGGMPRSLLLAAATARSFEEALPLFSFCVDALTPFYRDQMEGLALQQRRILALLARAEEPLPVKRLARELSMTHQTATALLKTLRDKAWVESSARGRESLYELADPMLRATLGLQADHEARQASMVDFLQAWFRDQPAPQVSRALWNEEEPEDVLVRLAASSSDPSRWREPCEAIVARARSREALGSLGAALIRSLPALGLGPDLLQSWRDLWLDVGGAQPALWQALRIFGAAVAFEVGGDEQILLALFRQERRLLARGEPRR